MKYLLLTSIATLAIFQAFAQKQTYLSGDYSGKKFDEIVQSIEDQSVYRFYYQTSWTDSVSTNYKADHETLDVVLKNILAGTDLEFAIHDVNVFITKKRKIYTDLPPGFFRQHDNERQRSVVDYSDYEKKDLRKKPEETKLYSIGDKNSSLEGSASLAGNVRAALNGEPVIGATIYLEELKRGTTTNEFGYYSISLPKGKHTLAIKSIGMKATQRHIILYSNGKLNVELDEEVTPLKEVVVESQHDSKVNTVQMGIERLDIHTMKQIPLALGETDIMKVVLTLPGVQSVGEGTVGLNVRGGASNQNLILLNDAVVYNPSHLFGFFSTFNPDVLKNVELYKSGIKAEYGGRLSSVLDVHTREGNTKKISGSGGISPITGRFTIEGPIFKNKTSFIVGGRSTYSNWILRQLDSRELSRSSASFYDLTGTITHHISDNDNLYVSGYTSNDNFRLSNDTTYGYSDRNTSIKWKHIFSNKLFGVVTGAYSNYKFGMNSEKNKVNAFLMNFNIRQWSAKADFNYYLNSRHTIDGGINVTHYRINPGKIAPVGNESIIHTDEVEGEHATEEALHISDNFEINPDLSLYVGVRYSFYQYLGHKNVNIYNADAAREAGDAIGSRTYSKNEIIRSYQGIEPRLSLRYSLRNNSAIKFGYNRMRQYIQMLSNTTAITPTDIWKLCDSYIKPQVGDQISIGFYKNLKGNLIETSIETYYKNIESTIDYKGGAVLLLNHHIETDIVEARGKAYGFEFMVKKSSGKVNGWVTYTYSRSFLKTTGKFSSEAVNDGRYYPGNFDKPHAFNFIGNYKFSRRFNFSMNLVYSTGRPITAPIAKYTIEGASRVLYSERNQYRIPDYFRSDISINIEGNHKIKKLAHSSWTLAIYNLTGRKNAYSVFFVTKNEEIKSYKLSVFARPIPTITYNFKF
jgi:hypothetical protein